MATKRNINAGRHLLHARGLTISRLKPKDRGITRAVNKLVGHLTTAVVSRKGSVTTDDACHIDAAQAWELHRRFALRWMMQHEATLEPEQKLAFSREVAKATENRNRAIRSLGLSNDLSTRFIFPDAHQSLTADCESDGDAQNPSAE